MGEQGPQGSQGIRGLAGPKGMQGDDGQSGDDVSFLIVCLLDKWVKDAQCNRIIQAKLVRIF